ncbi:MAG: OmpA family protein [Bacteroidales bacterium]
MRILSIKSIILAFAITLVVSLPKLSSGQISQRKGGLLRNKIEEAHITIQELTIDENIAIPIIISPFAIKKSKELISGEIKRLHKVKNITIKSERKGEVIRAIIPMNLLFQPNDTILWNKAEYMLRPFTRYTYKPDMFHILIVTHSDGTGSAEYNLNLTTKRAKAIMQWFENKGADKTYIATYGMGSEEQLEDNTSEENRKKNRRTEIYIIPAEALIKQAERGKVSL